MRIELPYGDGTVVVEVPEHKLTGVFKPHHMDGVDDLVAEVRRALRSPIESLPLCDLVRGRQTAAIVVDDNTRDVPSHKLLPPLVDELRAAGMRDQNITIIVATGLHRALTLAELDAIRGNLPVRIINHECENRDQLVSVGTTTLGQEIFINRTFVEADLKILTGDVEYHQFCGYGGGAKSVYPGMADTAAITHNHSMMDLDGTGPGRVEGNPVRREVDEVGRMAGVDFILNVVMNDRKEVVKAFAGHPFKAFCEGAHLVDRMYRVELAQPVDLVIASAGGYPRDINLYQSQKAVTVSRRVVREGGTIVTIAECRDGHGSELFNRWMTEAETIDDIFKRIGEKFVMGGHKAYQFAREIRWAKVCLLSTLPPEKVRDWFMTPLSGTAEVAELIDKVQSVAVIPEAVATLAELASR